MNTQIVIVQHGRELGRLFEHILRSHGYSVTLCNNLEQGLKTLEEHTADLVLLDKHAPDTTPDRACEHVWQCRPDIPVLMWGLDWTPPERQALGGDPGVLDFVAGPVEPQALLAHVRSMLPHTEARKIA